MEYKYYRDLKHNYLVLEDNTPEGDDRNRYQYKMLENSRIRGLVPSSERNINGQRYRYYEIGSMQPLRDRFAVGGMSFGQLRKLLFDVAGLLEELSEYLLGEEGLVLNARSVYTDLGSGENRFLFCPFYDEPTVFADFAAELLDLVDLSDEKAAELAYLLCEKSSEPGAFTLGTIKTLIEDGGDGAADQERYYSGKKENLSFGDAIKAEGGFSGNASYDDEFIYNETFDDLREDTDGAEKERGKEKNSGLKLAGKKLGGRFQLLFSLLFAAVVAAMMYIRMNFILTREENLMSILVMLVSLITGTVSFVSGIGDYSGKRVFRRKKDSSKESETYPDADYDDPDGFGDFGIPGDLEKGPIKVTGSFAGNNTGKMETERTAQPTVCGETVVLDSEKQSDELTLFSRNLDKTVRIGMEKLPVTIGKMEGCVDKVLFDNSISRIHCRLEKIGEKIQIIDLGSTNGTFLNGMRLSPRQAAFIDEGDEIRIGRVCFDCR